MRFFLLGIVGLSLAFAGCKGKTGPAGNPGVGQPGEDGEQGETGPPLESDPSISGVIPHEVFVDRVVDVTIIGYGTEWDDDATLNFGEGIEIVNIAVASPTSISATLRVAEDATVGPRTVAVSDSGHVATFEGGAFQVRYPISATLEGFDEVVQGASMFLYVTQHDVDTPFFEDLQNITPGQDILAYLVRDGEQVGATGYVIDLTSYSAGLNLFTDVNLPPGPVDLRVESTFDGSASFLADAFEVVARAPVALVEPGTTEAVEASESFLYSFSATQPAEITVSMIPDQPQTLPLVSVLPASGQWDDALPSSLNFQGFVLDKFFFSTVRFVATQPANFYAVMANAISDPVPHNATIGLDIHPVSIAPLSPPQVAADAIPLGDDADYYTIDIQQGQTLLAVTFDGATSTCASMALNSNLELFNDLGIDLIAANDDNGVDFCSQLVTGVPETGTYYLRVSASPFCGGCTFDYSLFVDFI